MLIFIRPTLNLVQQFPEKQQDTKQVYNQNLGLIPKIKGTKLNSVPFIYKFCYFTSAP
jgi:hypothetical protein